MMFFVDIKEFKSALEVENWLTPYKRGNAEITPEVCYGVLQATNFKRNIRDMLECILKLPVEKQAQFQDAVLSTFDNREQPNEIMVLGKRLAVAGGYERRLGKTAKIKEGTYLKSAPGVDRWMVTEEKDWSYQTLPSCQKLKFAGALAILYKAKNLPEELDFLLCKDVQLTYCDFSNVKKMAFKDGTYANLCKTENLPADLDVSMCQVAALENCDLAPLQKLEFRDGALARLQNAKNLPEELDFSRCSEVKLYGCDVSSAKNLRFKNRVQMKQSSLTLPKSWAGTLSFDEDAEMPSLLLQRGGRN